MYFCNFAIIPFEKEGNPLFDKIWFPVKQGCYVPNLVVIGPVVLKKSCQCRQCQCIFASDFAVISNYRQRDPSFEKTTSLSRKMPYVKIGWNWPSGSEKKNIKIWKITNGQTKRQADR